MARAHSCRQKCLEGPTTIKATFGQRVRSSNSADSDVSPAGTKPVELRKPCLSYLETHTVSLMETGTKLIRGTAIIRESHRFTIQEKAAFADVLQARRAASHEQDLLPVLTGTRLQRATIPTHGPCRTSTSIPSPSRPTRSATCAAHCRVHAGAIVGSEGICSVATA